jgi:hypothetical protein
LRCSNPALRAPHPYGKYNRNKSRCMISENKKTEKVYKDMKT